MDNETGFYPIFLDLRGKRCLVVGGGRVAERKVSGLLDAGARVKLVSPQLTPDLKRRSDAGEVEWVNRAYLEADLEGTVLVFATTSEEEVNLCVSRDASRRQIPANIADQTVPGDFIVPSSFRKGPLQVAVSTGGGSPALARLIRRDLECAVGDDIVDLAQMLTRIRPRVQKQFPDDEGRRRRVWDRLIAPDVLGLIQLKKWDRVEEIVSECLSS
jgi:precorrin-2 dehydrogenase/sirohydrochlorin ferrochelatase